MSPERLPSQDSGGGGNGSIINNGSSNSGSVNIIESATNMVLTNIPLESGGHVVIQHHPAQNQQQQQQSHRILNQQQQQSQQQLMTNGTTTITGGISSINRNNSNNNSSNGNVTTASNSNLINFSASNGSSSNVGSNGGKNSTIITKPIVTATSPTKCIFFQQAGNNNGSSSQQHQFITVTSDPHHQQHQSGQTFIATSPAAAAAVAAAGGNIVLVKTEPMEIINAEQMTTGNGTDEELTSLTWLHDKNLIKGIVACTNQPKSVTAAVTVAGAAISPLRQSNGGVINSNGITNGSASPTTNDYLDDSCVSEDNLSSVNSSSDQGISMNSVEHSPASSISSSSSTLIQNSSNSGGFSLQHQPQLYSQFSTASNTTNHHIQYTSSTAMKLSNNNTNSTVNKIRSHMLPITSNGSIIVSGAAAGISSVPPASNDHHIVGTTTTVHVGPSGTTTVVEYKPGSNFIVSPRSQIISQVPSSPQRLHSSSSSASFNTPSHSAVPQSSSATVVGITNSSTNSTTSNTTTTSTSGSYLQHHHKKYIREQMNGFETNSQNSSNTGVNSSNKTNGNSNANTNSSNTGGNTNPQNLTNAQSSSPKKKYSIAVYSSSDSQQQSESSVQEIKEYIQTTSTPIKSQQQQLHLPPSSSNYASSFTNDSEEHSKSSNYDSSYSSNTTRPAQSAQKSINSPKQKHPTNVPYDPLVHTHNKPPYSFSSLIFMAIEDSPEKALPVKEIYAWIVQHFPYFKTAPTGWKNSVRHNLSLNKSFLKVEKAPNMGKGSLWRVEENQRANLIQALTRSPFYPCSIVEKLSPSKSPSISQPSPIANDSPPSTPTKSTLDAKLFPKLSKMIKEMVNKGGGNESHATSNGYGTMNEPTQFENIEKLARDCGADSIEDVNAATAMLALKHGPKVFSESFNNGSPVITSSPSEDHTYSAGGTNGTGATNNGVITVNNGNGNIIANGVTLTGSTIVYTQNTSDNNSNGTLSDAAYESSEESQHHNISTREIEEEEERRHREGVDALLTFASKVSSMSSSGASSPVKRPASTSIEEEHISYINETISSRLNSNNNTNGFNSSSAAYIEDESSESYNGHNYQNGHEYRFTSSRGHEEHDRFNQSQPRSTQFHTQQASNSYFNHVISPSPAKKLKSSKNIRSKIKRKTAGWIR